ERRREVSLTEIGNDHHDLFAGILRSGRDLERGPKRRSGGDPHQEALLTGRAVRGVKGVVVGHGNNLVEDTGFKDIGHESGANALNRMGALGTAREHRGSGWLDGNDLDFGLTFL